MKNFTNKKGIALQNIDLVESLRKSDKTFDPQDNAIPGKMMNMGQDIFALPPFKKTIEVPTFMNPEKQELLRTSSIKSMGGSADLVKYVSCKCNDEEESYRKAVLKELKYLHFVGLPTRNYQRQQLMVMPELEKVYIDLQFYREDDDSRTIISLDKILKESNKVVILGEPGSGKTTLVKYLASFLCKKHKNDKSYTKKRLPFIISLFELQHLEKGNSDILESLRKSSEDNYNLEYIEKDFFETKLEKGEAVILFDGLDEIESESERINITKKITIFSKKYPKSWIWVTCRPEGYKGEVRLNRNKFNHYYLAPVNLKQAKQFVEKWYEIQIHQNNSFRTKRIKSLQMAFERDKAIGDLAQNPLILSIMVLLHQFEGAISDNRAVLYEKCIELLLKTWQDQKFSRFGIKNSLEEKGLKYDIQLRLLAALAFHLQEISTKSSDKNPLVI